MRHDLYYWPHLPGRGEFVRLVLEATAIPYRDMARLPEDQGGGIASILALRQRSHETGLFAPPFLQTDDGWFNQTVAICAHLAAVHTIGPQDPTSRSRALQTALTIADIVSEVHDTHHPLSTALTFEQQAPEAAKAGELFRNHRLPGWLDWMDALTRTHEGPGLLGPRSWVDLHAFHLLRGLSFAFPTATARELDERPALIDLYDEVASRPAITAYLQSTRAIPFNADGVFRYYPALDG